MKKIIQPAKCLRQFRKCLWMIRNYMSFLQFYFSAQEIWNNGISRDYAGTIEDIALQGHYLVSLVPLPIGKMLLQSYQEDIKQI